MEKDKLMIITMIALIVVMIVVPIFMNLKKRKSKFFDYDSLPGRPDMSPPYQDEETELP